MSKKYYTLCERTPGQLYAPQFGSFIKAEVVQERADMKDSGSFIKGTEFAIIETSGSQRAITVEVELLNTDKVRAKARAEQERVIVPKLPNDARKNIAKLERGGKNIAADDRQRDAIKKQLSRATSGHIAIEQITEFGGRLVVLYKAETSTYIHNRSAVVRNDNFMVESDMIVSQEY